MLERVLIIDATEDVEHLVRFCVRPYWPDVILETYDPRSGIPEQTFEWFRYDLLLLDYDLAIPDENGLDWLREFKRNPYLPPVIMLTGYASKRLEAEAMKLGADGFLDKDSLSPKGFGMKVKQILMDSENREDAENMEFHADGKTEILSPQERHDVMKMLQNVEDSSNELSEGFDKTRLMNRDEMLELVGRGKDRIVSGRDYTTPGNKGHAASVPDQRMNSPRRTSPSYPRVRQSTGEHAITVPGYLVEKKIGEGGMATIYLARREEDQLRVVLKVLKLEGQKDSSLLRRFMREYKLIAQLEHPHIVQIHERAFASNFAYIAMEYFPFGDLTERLQKGLDPRTALSYLKQIAEGLGAAHDQGIVHRDMKPANILFRTHDVLAITDFGIAKIVDLENQVKKELTMDGSLMGTLYYISPEQIEGAEADRRSDIYSLGVIMYKMLTGMHPFDGKTPYEVFEGHLRKPIPKLTGKFANLQPLLDGLLSKDPDERFQSTDDLVMGIDWNEY